MIFSYFIIENYEHYVSISVGVKCKKHSKQPIESVELKEDKKRQTTILFCTGNQSSQLGCLELYCV